MGCEVNKVERKVKGPVMIGLWICRDLWICCDGESESGLISPTTELERAIRGEDLKGDSDRPWNQACIEGKVQHAMLGGFNPKPWMAK
ncbi:hypothetical protein Nepgr_002450 [Nepenthes gracilis]|uniref:Uncharacterized protein n=1 Tax=Nepenthes gracilis TaxID=150966 RepID=A0AAD3P6A0_NEPGR|nr:hypothetical protein Nepgr_002450 [Nepenthes gracilis]